MSKTCTIVRFYQRGVPAGAITNDAGNAEIIQRGVSLEEARAHCNDPETSSSTAQGADATARTEAHGPWFDGWYAEES